MCLIFFSLNDHPEYKLIVAANRDEFYNRRTEAAHYWKDHPEILGGRDLEANGTWMAMTRSGKISLLTNYRDPLNINPSAPSRGQLVSNYLERNTDAETYLKEIQKIGEEYNGFNLIVGSPENLWYYSNYSEGIKKLNDGLHGLSNHLMDTPWPKVSRGKAKFKILLETSSILTSDALFDFLYDTEPAADALLPDTGIGLERERALSSMFIKTNGYGSRCSTLVLVDRNNLVTYAERVYDIKTFSYSEQTFKFQAQ